MRAPASLRRVPWILSGGLGLLLTWICVPGNVPVYDGIGNPDEPYRWVQPHPGARTGKPPSPAVVTLRAAGGRSLDAGQATSSEVGPQVKLFVPALSLGTAAGARSVTVTAVPLAPSEPLPSEGRIVTNVYRLSARASGGPVRVVGTTDRATPVIQMRAPTGRQPGPVFEHRSEDGRWQRVPTTRVGVDVYQALVPALGDWALVQVSSRGTGSGRGVAAAALVTAVIVVAAVVLGVRRRSERAA